MSCRIGRELDSAKGQEEEEEEEEGSTGSCERDDDYRMCRVTKTDTIRNEHIKGTTRVSQVPKKIT